MTGFLIRRPIAVLMSMLALITCTQKKQHLASKYILQTTNEVILPIDEGTLPYTKAMFSFREGGIDYLGYLNQGRNEILIFDLDNQTVHKKISLEQEGENGVGSVRGFMYFTKDSIFITSNSDKRLYLVNDSGRVIDKFSYRKTSDDKDTGVAFYSRTNINTPLIKVGSKVYLTNYIPGNFANLTQQHLNKLSVCTELDLHSGDVNLLAMSFPDDYWSDGSRHEPSYARIFDGERFVYLWRYYDNLLVTTDHETIEKFPMSSYYFNKIAHKPLHNDLQLHIKHLLESPSFFNVIYDEYRKLYYVFAYPGIEVEKGEDVMKLWQFLPVFSVIIFDRDFQKIGETKMPKNTYHIENYFVTEKGLHISKSHPLNKDFNENSIKFDVFIPVIDE